MWNLFRKIPAGKTYAELVAEDPKVKFDYFVSENPTEANCDDVTDNLVAWDIFSETDYFQARTGIIDATENLGWGNLDATEKEIAIRYRAVPSASTPTNVVVGHYMGLGMSLPEVQGMLIKAGAEEQLKLIEACRERGTSVVLYMIIGKYLTYEDQATLNNLVKTLLDNFIHQGIRGVNDGQNGQAGLFDFIEGTAGTEYEIINLFSQDFTMQNGDPDASNFIQELMDWLRHGKTNF